MVRNITIQFSVRSAIILLVAAAAVWLAVNFNSLLIILFIAILLAVAITPLVNRMDAFMPRVLAIVFVYLVLIAIAAAAVGLLVPVLLAEITQLTVTLPKLSQQLLALPNEWVPSFMSSSKIDIAAEIQSRIGGVVSGIGAILLSLGATATTLLIDVFLILIIALFMTNDGRFAPHFIARFFPPQRRDMVAEVTHDMGGRLGHWVRAQILVGICFGAMFGLGLKLMGVPYAFSLGVAGAILELIPYVGGAIVTLIAMLVALTISPLLALGVLGLELVVANIESHIIYPKLVGDIVGLHPIVIIIALFIGAEAQGIVGALLAVPAAVVLQVLFEHFYRFEDTPAPASAAEEGDEPTAPNMAEPRKQVLSHEQKR